MKRNLYATLTFWFITVSLIPILMVSFLTFNQRIETFRKREGDKLIAIRDLKVLQLKSWLSERQYDIQALAEELSTLIKINQDGNARSDFGVNEMALRLMEAMLNRFVKNYPLYQEAFIVDPESGVILMSTETAYQGLNKSTSPYFITAVRPNDIFISDIYYSRKLRHPTLCFSGALKVSEAEGEKIMGILVTRVDLEASLFHLLSDTTSMGKTGETLIVNNAQLLLCRLKWQNDLPLTLTDNSQATVNAAAGQTGLMETDDYRQEPVIAAYTHIPQIGWGLIVKQDYREVFAPIKQAMLEIALLLALLMLGLVLIALLLARSLARPVVEMSRVSQQIMEGDLSARHKVGGHAAEIDFLAISFNAMTDSLVSGMIIQQGVAEVNQILVWTSRLADLRSDLLNRLMQVTHSRMGAYYIYQDTSGQFEHFTSVGVDPKLMSARAACAPLSGLFGDMLLTRRITRISNIPENAVFTYTTFVGDLSPKEILALPVLVGDDIAAIITLATINGYSKEHLTILEQLWPGINSVVSNLRAAEKIQNYAEQLELQNSELEAQAQSLSQMSHELQRRNQLLETQQRRVEEADRLKTEFLSNMSHELRTPLNSILTLSRVLSIKSAPKLDAEEVRYLGIVERNGKLLLELINDILDLSKIEAGKIELSPQPTAVITVLSSIIERLAPLAEQKEINLMVEENPDLPEIVTDHARLHQILQNIIGNAIKFTEKGQVVVRLKHDAEVLYIMVADTGIGIPEKDLPFIFEAFRQVDGSTSRRYEGTGLGLAIAAKSALLLGGGISVESQFGRGSLFTIRLPLKGMSQVAQNTAEIKIGAFNHALSRDIASENQARKKLLLVEDNPSSLLLIRGALENNGYQVDLAGDGLSAMAYLRHHTPDAILLDLVIPGIDGFEVLRYVRNQEIFRQTPVLIITVKDINAAEHQRLRNYRISAILRKGEVDEKELLENVRRLFVIDPPAVPAAPVPPTMNSPPNRPPSGPDCQTDPVFAKNRSSSLPLLLAVEDNPDNLAALKAIIGDQYDFIEARDGLSGLNLALAQTPDLILLDMALPDLDGMSVAQQLKNGPRTANIPIIALTAYAMKGDRERILAAGCDDYISKPINPELLLSAIGKQLRKVKGEGTGNYENFSD